MLRSLTWASLGTGFIFLMTTLGAAVVFFFAGEIKLRLQAVMMGFAAGECRMPLCAMSEAHRNTLKTAMQNAGLI